jgi:MFS family permease
MIIAGGSTMIVGTIILGSSNTLAQLLVGRIVTGIGNGFNSKLFQLSCTTTESKHGQVPQSLPTRWRCVEQRIEEC